MPTKHSLSDCLYERIRLLTDHKGSETCQVLLSEGTDLQVFDQWPVGTDSLHPEERASPWASVRTGPARADCPHTQSSERPPPHSGIHPVKKV